MTPSVGVIVPCYDQARFIGQAIRSVLGQSSAVAEVIVVDDGSQDASAAIAEAFGPPVTVLSRPRGGAAAARNAGLQRVRSPLVAFLDADDLWPPRSLEFRLNALLTTSADIVYGIVEERYVGSPDRPGRRASARCAGSMIMRRETFDRVGPFRHRNVPATRQDALLQRARGHLDVS